MKIESLKRMVDEYQDLLVRIQTLAHAPVPIPKDVGWANSGVSDSTLVRVIELGVAALLKTCEARVLELQKTLNIEQ